MHFLLSFLFLLAPLAVSAETLTATETFGGVGITIQQNEGKTFVQSVIEGYPAHRDGRMASGDLIVAVQPIADADAPWTSVEGLTIHEVANLIRGEVGTSVGIALSREDSDFSVELVRELIEH